MVGANLICMIGHCYMQLDFMELTRHTMLPVNSLLISFNTQQVENSAMFIGILFLESNNYYEDHD